MGLRNFVRCGNPKDCIRCEGLDHNQRQFRIIIVSSYLLSREQCDEQLFNASFVRAECKDYAWLIYSLAVGPG